MALLIIGDHTRAYAEAAKALDKGFDIRLWPDAGPLEEIRFALAWNPPAGVLATLPGLEVILSVGAGVDHLLKDPSLPDVPITRFVDPDLTGRMCEYIVLHTLYHHRRMSELAAQQRRANWVYLPEPAAPEIRVGIMGLGVLGQAAVAALKPFGYQLAGWSAAPKTMAGVATFAGEDELTAFLGRCDILIALLPLTAATKGILGASLIDKLARDGALPGPVLINAGRGGLHVEADIVTALDSGALYAASLDVFETEPLPASSKLWSHPHVVITPHNAAESSPRAIARYAIRQMAAHSKGEPLANLVDRTRGY